MIILLCAVDLGYCLYEYSVCSIGWTGTDRGCFSVVGRCVGFASRLFGMAVSLSAAVYV